MQLPRAEECSREDIDGNKLNKPDIERHTSNLEYTVSPINVTAVYGSGFDLTLSAVNDIVVTRKAWKLQNRCMYAYT